MMPSSFFLWSVTPESAASTGGDASCLVDSPGEGALRLLDRLEVCADSPRDVAFLRLQQQSLLVHEDQEECNDTSNDVNNENGCPVPSRQTAVSPAAAPVGLALTLVGALQGAVKAVHQRLRVYEEWLPPSSSSPRRFQSSSEAPLSESDAIQSLQRILKLLRRLSVTDITLSEEVVMEGSHAALQTILGWDAMAFENDSDQDVLVELQDAAGVLAAYSPLTFPHVASSAPFSVMELRQRLPLVFSIKLPSDPSDEVAAADGENYYSKSCEPLPDPSSSSSVLSVLIHQVTDRQAAQQDVGFVLWPSAVVLARYLVHHPYLLHNATQICELGAGCGLVGLTAAVLIAQQQQKQTQHSSEAQPYSPIVCLTDCNATVLQNLERNVRLNEVTEVCRVASLDFHNPNEQPTEWAEMQPPDLVLAADVICQPSDAVAMAHWLSHTLRPGRTTGGQAVVVSAAAQHRFGVDALVPACHNCGLEVSMHPVQELDGGQLLRECANDLAHTSGYVDSMQLNLYLIRKSREMIDK